MLTKENCQKIEKYKINKYIRAMSIYSILRENFSFVVPMLYLKRKNAYKSLICKRLYFLKAVRTRLELATPCVTGMYSNQTELPDLFAKSECKYILFFISAKKYFTFWKKN